MLRALCCICVIILALFAKAQELGPIMLESIRGGINSIDVKEFRIIEANISCRKQDNSSMVCDKLSLSFQREDNAEYNSLAIEIRGKDQYGHSRAICKALSTHDAIMKRCDKYCVFEFDLDNDILTMKDITIEIDNLEYSINGNKLRCGQNKTKGCRYKNPN